MESTQTLSIVTGSGINVANGRPRYFAYTYRTGRIAPVDENSSIISEADARGKAERRMARWGESWTR